MARNGIVIRRNPFGRSKLRMSPRISDCAAAELQHGTAALACELEIERRVAGWIADACVHGIVGARDELGVGIIVSHVS